METKHKVFNLIILDESGSMQSIKNTIISGFNEVVQTIKGVAKEFSEQEHFISFITFNGRGIKTHLENTPVTQLNEINADNYRPDEDTPLYDAIGLGVNRLRATTETHSHYNVLVTILTDGEENASKEYSGKAIKKLIQELKKKNWTFTYMGTDHDVEKAAFSMSITNTISFSKDTADIKRVFEEDKAGRIRYSQKIRDKVDTTDEFYTDKHQEKKSS